MIGPTIVEELTVAGVLGKPFSWGENGSLNLDDPRLTEEEKTAIKSVFKAHDPTKQLDQDTQLEKEFDGNVWVKALAMESGIDIAKLKTRVKQLKGI